MDGRLFLEGRWEPGAALADVKSPWDGRVVAQVAQASAAQAEAALAFAYRARRAVGATSAGQRRAVLDGVVQGLRVRGEELAQRISCESGKPLTAARAEVTRATETFVLAAAELSRFGGGVVPVDLLPNAVATEAELRRFPAGVVVGIVPFNFPLNLGAHKVAPALAVGAPLIIKPPPQAPGAMLLLAELVEAAGAVPGALQVLPCDNGVAERLATDARVRVTSFTGSARVGWSLKGKVAGRAVLELGGNAAAIVCPDAHLEHAAQRLAVGALTHAGQVCIKVQRIIVEAAAWDAFVPRFLAEVAKVPCGDPARPEVVVGPVIDEAAATRIEAWVEEALARGAQALVRGTRQGLLLSPTVLTGVPRDARAYAEEIFGPVVVLEKVPDFDAALEAVNAGRFGLQAAVFTNSLSKSRRAFHELEVGGVILNDAPSFRSDNQPYGGCKDSGLGREGVRSTMEDYTEERVLVYRPQ